MKLSKEQIAGMIGRISRHPTLLHGTSVESVLRMFKTGRLPPGTELWRETNGYLYFSPIKYVKKIQPQGPEERRILKSYSPCRRLP